jgi:hypothetical protein
MLVMSYGVVLFDCVSFSVYSELNKIKKRQKSLGVLKVLMKRNFRFLVFDVIYLPTIC